MRLREEKKIIIAEIILLFFVLFCSIIIEISDSKISEWNMSVLVSQNNAVNTAIGYLKSSQINNFYFLVDLILREASLLGGEDLNISYGFFDSELLDSKYVDPKIKDIANEFNNKRISQFEYLDGMQTISYNEYSRLQKVYYQQAEKVNNLIKDDPVYWELLKSKFRILQIVGIFILIFIYCHLYLSISRRYNQKI